MPKWVKLKEYGSTKEMNRKRVGIRGYRFVSGKWVSDVPDELAEYLMKNERAPSGDPYFVVADTMTDAVQEASKSQQLNVFIGGETVGSGQLSDGELLAKAAAANMAATVKAKPEAKAKPKAAPKPKAKAKPKKAKAKPKPPPQPERISQDEVLARIGAAINNSTITAALDEHFGDDLYRVVKDDPGCLSEVDGVGRGRIKRIVEALEDV